MGFIRQFLVIVLVITAAVITGGGGHVTTKSFRLLGAPEPPATPPLDTELAAPDVPALVRRDEPFTSVLERRRSIRRSTSRMGCTPTRRA